MHVTKSVFLKTSIVLVAMVILLVPAVRIHAAAPAFNPKDPANVQKLKDFEATMQSKKLLSVDTKKSHENISGTITAISGTDITVTISNPSKGQPATVVVHAASANVTRTISNVPETKTTPGSSDSIKKLSSHTGSKNQVRSTTAASAGLAVGDIVTVSGVKNTNGTLTASYLFAHTKKGPRPTTVVIKPKA